MNVLKLVAIHNAPNSTPEVDDEEKKDEEKDVEDEVANFICTNPECTRSRPGDNAGNVCVHAEERMKVLEKEKQDKLTEIKSTNSTK